MEIIFNELSTGHLAPSNQDADEWMECFFSTPAALSRRLYKPVYIRATINLREKLIASNYSFVEWLHGKNERDRLRKIISILTHSPLLEKYPYYYCDGAPCEGLGVAHAERKMSVSYPAWAWASSIRLKLEEFNEQGEVQVSMHEVKNLSSSEDVACHFPNRIYDHHKKHDNRRVNLQDGESTLYYDIPEEQEKVQKLLDCSFGENGNVDERLYNYDGNMGLYMEFNCHTSGRYHGYHIRKDLENRVPNSVKKKILKFIQEP